MNKAVLLFLLAARSGAQITPPPAEHFEDKAGKTASERALESLERAVKETGSGMAAGALERATNATAIGPPAFYPYVSCYLSVSPFSRGNLYKGASPLVGKEKDIIVLPGPLEGRLGLFAFAGGEIFFHFPKKEPAREALKRAIGRAYFDRYELILRLPESSPLYLVYKEKYRTPFAKRKPRTRPFSYVLFEVDSLALGSAETARPIRLTTQNELSDAFSTLRRKLGERIDSMEKHYKKTRTFFNKNIVGNPDRSQYYRSLKPCEAIKDDAIRNAVKRAKPIFLKKPRRR